MMDHKTEVMLQALLDGELSEAQTATARAVIDRDAEARALYEELRSIKVLLAGNEIEWKLSEAREFYWSGIQREIEREERSADSEPRPTRSLHAWLRLLLPVGAVGIVALSLALGWNQLSGSKSNLPALAGSHDIETPLEDAPSFTFRSEPEAMTVVWVDSGPN